MVTSMLDARNDARNEGGTYQRVEVITGRQRRRRWTAEEKARIVAESLEADANISDVARRHGVARGLLTIWRRQLSSGGGDQEPATKLCRGEDRSGCRGVDGCPAIFSGAGCGGDGIAGGAEPRTD